MRRIDEIRERLDKATPGPWVFGSAPAVGSDETPADYLAGALTGYGPLFVVWVPSTEGNPGGYVLTAATGDGPHASQDAELISNAPADLAWLLGEVERLSAERMQPEQPEPTDAEILAAAEESEYHEQWGYDENGFPHCECGASLVESEHDLGVAPSLTAHQTREALLAARKAARREKAARHE